MVELQMDEKVIRKIPFYKPSLGEAEIEAVRSTLADGWITTGPKVKKFEAEMAAYTGSKYALAVNSCTAALHLALAAAGIKKGDKVITTPYTFAATVETIIWCGAQPVLVDIDPETLNIDPVRVEKKIDKRTTALVSVDMAGLPCDYDALRLLAKKQKVFLLADAAHSLGASYKGVKVGRLADATAFSFYSTKNLTTGEGGMLVTGNRKLHEKAAILALHGMSKDAWKRYTSEGSWYYEIVAAGFKYNLSDLQASIGLAQLEKFPQLQERRRYLAGLYDRYLTPYLDMLELPPRSGHSQHAWHMYLIRLKPKILRINREELLRQLSASGIGTSVHFIPVHLHPFYRKFLGHKPVDFPNALATFRRIFTPPFYPAMSDQDVEYVCSTLGEILRGKYKSSAVPVGAKKKAELVG